MHEDIKDALRIAKRRHYYDGGTVADAMMSDDPSDQAAANFARAGYSSDQINDNMAYQQGTPQTNQTPTQGGTTPQVPTQSSASSFNPVSYYTPNTQKSASLPFTGLADGNTNQSDEQVQAPTLQSGQSYSWSPLYPAAGSGSNIPHAPAPPGASPLTNQAPSHDWQLPYSAMGGSQWGGGQWGGGTNSGTGLKTGPSTGNQNRQTPQRAAFGGEISQGDNTMHQDIKDALRLAKTTRRSGAQPIGSVEPMPDYMSRDDWTPERWAQARRNRIAKTPNSGPSATTPRSSSETTPKVSPEEYRRGNLGEGNFALARGGSAGRKGYAVGGIPTELTAGTNPAATTPSTTPAADPYQGYVNSLYKNVMGREADIPGQQYWTNQLNTGAQTTQDVLNNFAASKEFQNLYAANPNQAVSNLYQSALGRAPEQAGLDYWTQQARGVNNQPGLSANQLLSQFETAPEYQVRDLALNNYAGILGTAPTPEQYASAQNAYGRNKSLSDVTAAIQASPEALNQTISNAYQGILGRAPDPEGLKFWQDQITSGAQTPDFMLNALANSVEGINFANTQTLNDSFRGNFGRDPTPQEIKDPNSIYNDLLSKMAAGTINNDQLQQTLAKDPEAQDYQNTSLIKNTFKSLTGQLPDQTTIDDFASKMAAGTLTPDDLYSQVASTPQSQKWMSNTGQGTMDDLVHSLAGKAQDLTSLAGRAATKAKTFWDQLMQLSPDMAGDIIPLLGLESGSKGLYATAGNSSAAGLGQQIDSTYISNVNKMLGTNYTMKNAPDWIKNARTSADPNSQAVVLGSVLQNTIDNAKRLTQMGLPVNAVNLYALHNLGEGGGPAFLRAFARNPNAPMGSIAKQLGGANAILKNHKLYPQGLRTTLGDAYKNFQNELYGSKDNQNWGTNVINQLKDVLTKPTSSPTTPTTPGTTTTPDTFKPGDQSSTTPPINLGVLLAGQGAGGNAAGNTGAGTGITTGNQPGVTLGAAGNEALAAALAQQAAAQQAAYAGTGVPNNSYDANLAYLAGTGAGNAGASPGVVTPGAISTASSGKGIDFNAGLQGSGIASSGSTGSNPANYTFTPATGTGFTGTGSPIGTANWYTAPIYTPPSYGGGGYYGGGSYGTGYSSGYSGGGYSGYGGTSVGSGGFSVGFMNKGGAVWDKSRPKSLGKPKHLSSKQKASAKAAAKAAGRPYPNLVDNMRAAQKAQGGCLSKAMNLTRRLLDE